MFIFLAISVRFLEDARQPQGTQVAVSQLLGTQGVRTTDAIVRHPYICFTKAARLSQDSRAFIARLPYDVSLCPTTVFQISQDRLATALHVNVRQSYEHRTAALRSLWFFRKCLRSASGSLRSVPHAKIARSYVPHDWCETGFKVSNVQQVLLHDWFFQTIQ